MFWDKEPLLLHLGVTHQQGHHLKNCHPLPEVCVRQTRAQDHLDTNCQLSQALRITEITLLILKGLRGLETYQATTGQLLFYIYGSSVVGGVGQVVERK